MNKYPSYDLIGSGMDALASAIVVQAADDYKRSRFILDTLDMRKYKDEDSKYTAYIRANREVKSVYAFFKSIWFWELSHLDGEKAFSALEETYLKEYYPVRMEEMLDETKIGRFRSL